MTITVPSTLSVGDSIQVCVSSSSRKNQTVTLTVEDGEGNDDTIEVQLDASGEGCATWNVPSWDSATFEDGKCDAVVRSIDP